MLGEAFAAAFLARQAATAVAYTRQQLGYTSRAALLSGLRPRDRVLEIGPGEGAIHADLPPGLHYTAIDSPLVDGAAPPLPVQQRAESFSTLQGPWQSLMPRLAEQSDGNGAFDCVLVVLPSTIYFGPEQGVLGGVIRTGLRLPRPREEWQELSRCCHALLAPGGTMLVADCCSSHSLIAAALLPFSQRTPPLGPEVLRRDFERVEVVREPSRFWHEPELLLRAHKGGKRQNYQGHDACTS